MIYEEIPTEEEQETKIQEASEEVRVSPFDVDFILILFLVAIPADLLSIVLTIIALFTETIGWWVWLLIDILISFPIYLWIKWRLNKIAKSKEERKREVEKFLRQRAQALEAEATRLEKNVAEGGEEAAKIVKTATREGAEEAGKAARAAAKTMSNMAVKLAGKSSAKVFLRIMGRCLLKAIPFIGCIPFWTITVFETLKEK
jgi:F0F1-type ATP synthase membrane subunit b/b'